MWVITSNCEELNSSDGYFEVVFDKKPSIERLGKFLYNMNIQDMSDEQISDVVALYEGKCKEGIYCLEEYKSGVQKSI